MMLVIPHVFTMPATVRAFTTLVIRLATVPVTLHVIQLVILPVCQALSDFIKDLTKNPKSHSSLRAMVSLGVADTIIF